MFSVSDINFSNGVYSKGKINGAEVMIMERMQRLDVLVKDFERAIAAGYNPNYVKDEIFRKRGITESDLTKSEIESLEKRISAIYKSYQSRGY